MMCGYGCFVWTEKAVTGQLHQSGMGLLECCCGSLLRGDDDCMRLYDILEVPKNATDDELKRAYRKMSLKLHPDKRGNAPEAQAEFSDMKAAYDILSDPEKRAVYDQLGDLGLQMTENPQSVNPEVLARHVLRATVAQRSVVVLVIAVVLGLILLFPLFICLRIDGTTDWSWASVWVPVWMVLALWTGLLYVAFRAFHAATHPKKKEDGEEEPAPLSPDAWPVEDRIAVVAQMLLLLLGNVFLVMRMDGTTDWSWWVVLLPWLVLELVWSLASVTLVLRAQRELSALYAEGGEVKVDVESGEPTEASQQRTARLGVLKGMRRAAGRRLVWALGRLLTALLLASALADGAVGSYWVAFAPTMAAGALLLGIDYRELQRAREELACVKRGSKSRPRSRSSSLSNSAEEAFLADVDEEQVEAAAAAVTEASAAFKGQLVWAVLFYTTLSVALALAEGADYSAFMVAIPLFVVMGLLFCCCCCVVCVSNESMMDGMGEVMSTSSRPSATSSAGGAGRDSGSTPAPAAAASSAAAAGQDRSYATFTSESGSASSTAAAAAAAAPSGGGSVEPAAPVMFSRTSSGEVDID